MNLSLSKMMKSMFVALLSMAAAQSAHANPFTLDGQCSAQAFPVSAANCTIGLTLTDANANNPSQVERVAFRINNVNTALRYNDRSNPSTGTESSATGAIVQVACGQSYRISALVLIKGQSQFIVAGNNPVLSCP